MSAITPVGLDVTIEDKQYTFSPLRFADIEWLELRLRAKAIEAGRMSIPEDASPAEAEQIMQSVLEHANGIDLFRNPKVLMAPSTIVLMLYRMAHQNHPEVTLEDAGRWVQSKEFVAEVRPQLSVLMGVKKNPPAQEPEKPKRSRGAKS